MTTFLHGDAHVRRYQETDGEDGYDWRNGTTILLLTTTGRKSGKERTHALIYRDYDDKYLVVASKGGSDAPPTWFGNIEADPNVAGADQGRQVRGAGAGGHAGGEAGHVEAHDRGVARLRQLPAARPTARSRWSSWNASDRVLIMHGCSL